MLASMCLVTFSSTTIASSTTKPVEIVRPGAGRPARKAPTLPLPRRARARAREGDGNQRRWPADKVERWAIERLIPYAKNARTHTDAQVAAIAASIKEWG
jgi:hypothetical protein